MPKEQLEDTFLTPVKFSIEIEKLVKNSNGLITYIEAVVAYCQEKEIIHRDIKPESLVIDMDGYVRITDFGIARIWRPENA